jgi:hypothetical protein
MKINPKPNLNMVARPIKIGKKRRTIKNVSKYQSVRKHNQQH